MHEKYTDRLREEYLKGRNDEREESKDKYDAYMENKYKSGYDDGYFKACKDFADSNNLNNLYTTSYDEGYEDGNEDGYEDGWDAGYDEGYVSSIIDIEDYSQNKNLFTQSAIESLLNYLDKQRD